MGKAIRNFKDALSGVEDAKFRRIEGENATAQKAAPQPPVAEALKVEATTAESGQTKPPSST